MPRSCFACYLSRSVRRGLTGALLALLALAAVAPLPPPAHAQRLNEDPAALMARIVQLYRQGSFAEAVPMARRLVAITYRLAGPGTRDYGQALYALGNLLAELGNYAEAELYLRESDGAYTGAGGPAIEHAQTRVVLATVLGFQNRRGEAVTLMRAAAADFVAVAGPDDPRTVRVLNNLAQTLQLDGRSREAEPILRQLLEQLMKRGDDHFSLGAVHSNLAGVMAELERGDESLEHARRSVEHLRKVDGGNSPYLAIALNNLAQRIGGYGPEVEALLRESLAVTERNFGARNANYATALSNLAELVAGNGRHGDAEKMVREVVATFEAALGPSHPRTASGLRLQASLAAARGAWEEADRIYGRVNELAVAHLRQGGFDENRSGASVYGLDSRGFTEHLRVLNRLGAADPAVQARAFVLAQRAQTTVTAAAVGKMAARFAAGTDDLAGIVREQQRLRPLRATREESVHGLITRGPGNQAQLAEARRDLADIDAELVRLETRLSAEFPQYTRLVTAEPVSLDEARAMLAEDEVLVIFVEIGGSFGLRAESHVLALTTNGLRWHVLDVPERPQGWRVPTLRCGLDLQAWRNAPQICEQLTGRSWSEGDGHPPFRLARAHEMYRELFGPIEDLLRMPDGRWRHILVQPTGHLHVIPLQTLVTEPPTEDLPSSDDGYRKAAWLGTRQPMTTLPSVASLHVLRRLAGPSRAAEPYLGFGNPLLRGGDGRDTSAETKGGCEPRSGAGGPARKPVALAARIGRDGLADVAELRRLDPLPETVDELCAVARLLGAENAAVVVGPHASETRVKELSASGALARVRVVHFATHGLLAQESQRLAAGLTAPALVMTPPAIASSADDGLLTDAEIAQLRLDADWVILSACNTAAGSGGIDTLSGLARAFFYAGARSMLVSHWPVDSHAAVALVTGAFAELRASPGLGRAEAMRRAMRTVIAAEGRAHPSIWAPFVVVGEGGAVPPR